jgi:hypothetical protein
VGQKNTKINKVVYVLVSQQKDCFSEMALVSIMSLRIVSPEVQIEVVMDKKTHSGLSGHRSKLLDMVDIVTISDVHHENPMVTSRRIKTRLRELVDNVFLFIDVDAVPVKPIDKIFSLESDLALAYDMNVRSLDKNIHLDSIRSLHETVGWSLPDAPYYNTGVILVHDTAKAKLFYKLWNKYWEEASGFGIYQDQPPFHRALRDCNITIAKLDPQWNALIGLISSGVKGARIMHYTTMRFENRNDTVFHSLVKDAKRNGEVNVEKLLQVMRSGYPWTDDNSIKYKYAVGDYTGTIQCIGFRIKKYFQSALFNK